jgi:hypothetical protein
MQLSFATEVPLCFSLVFPEHVDKFVQIWREFKHFFAVWISLLQSQPFTSNNFPLPHYCVTGELVSFTSAAHTIEPDVLEVPNEMSANIFESYVRWVGLVSRVETELPITGLLLMSE